MRRAVRALVFKGNSVLLMKRNKFGALYYTLPGGGIGIGESAEQALLREMQEETGVQLGDARLIYVENAGEPYGVQYIYLADYVSGEPKLNPSSDEASITAMGKNTYEPLWHPIADFEQLPFVSKRLQAAIAQAVKSGFPAEPVTID